MPLIGCHQHGSGVWLFFKVSVCLALTSFVTSVLSFAPLFLFLHSVIGLILLFNVHLLPHLEVVAPLP